MAVIFGLMKKISAFIRLIYYKMSYMMRYSTSYFETHSTKSLMFLDPLGKISLYDICTFLSDEKHCRGHQFTGLARL